MSKLVAAYDFGLNALGLRYNIPYLRLFPWDRLASGGQGVCNSLNWINDNLAILAPEIADTGRALQISQVVGEFHLLLTAGRLTGRRGSMTDRRLKQLWMTLAGHSRAALHRHRRLYPWYRLGEAMAHCFLDLLDQDRLEVLPSLPEAVRAAASLPMARADRVDVLRRLRTHDATAAATRPLDVLRQVLAEEATDMDAVAPLAVVIPKVSRLDRQLKAALAAQPDPPMLQVGSEEDGSHTALLNGRPYPISFHQAEILRSICQADGEVVSGPKMKRDRPTLESANISFQIQELPSAIGEVIIKTTGRHGGFALQA